ncbi:MAG TPA: methyl-accepting chemotaxis protein [Dissulfurispiraceae bacterium]|nr:methyl-accepting chemotaxis protein [Dissulfurispiraceae bacterium]
MLQGITMKKKLLLLLGSLILFLAAVGGIGYYGMKVNNAALETVYTDRLVPVKDLKAVSDAYAVNIVDTSHKMRNGNLTWEQGAKNITDAKKMLTDSWKAYISTYLDDREKKLVAETEPLMKKAEESVNKLQDIVAKKDRQRLDSFVVDEMYAIIDPVTEHIDKLVEHQQVVGKEEFDKASSLASTVKILAIVLFIVALIWSIFFGSIVVKDVLAQVGGEPREISILAEKIASGDLSMTFKDTQSVTGIYASIVRMSERLKTVISSVRTASASMASGSEQLSASSEEITRTMGEQSARSTQIATAADEMSQTVVDIAKNAANIAEAANETVEIAKKGADVVNRSVEESREIAGAVNSSAEVMQTLGEKSKLIGEIVGVINDIADQTNLLALNAAIEAARAGEQGRGFAVVADEVRKLAERTGKATSEIGGMIRSIQTEVDGAIEAMQAATKKVDVGLQYSQEAGTELGRIVQSADGLKSMVQMIASATEEMSTTSETISADIQGIAAGSSEMSQGVSQIAQASSELARLAGELKGNVDLFRV